MKSEAALVTIGGDAGSQGGTEGMRRLREALSPSLSGGRQYSPTIEARHTAYTHGEILPRIDDGTCTLEDFRNRSQQRELLRPITGPNNTSYQPHRFPSNQGYLSQSFVFILRMIQINFC